MKIKKYDVIIPLGHNCETAFQLQYNFGHIDSYPFNWSFIHDKYKLIDCIKNPSLIFSSEVEENSASNMWKCITSEISFHGIRKPEDFNKYNKNALKKEKTDEPIDLKSRTVHLVDKLKSVWQSGCSQLYILTIKEKDTKNIKKYIVDLQNALKSKTKNFHILAVLEKINDDASLKDSKNIFYRFIENYTPWNNICDTNKADMNGWARVLSEFQPSEIKEKNKIYKFEKTKINTPKIKILISYHKPSLLLESKILTPIHAGREVACNPSKDGNICKEDVKWLYDRMIGDNTGDNISKKNRFYNETTSIYWAWRNQDAIGNPDYIGFMHYRRQFIFDDNKVAWYKNCHTFAPDSEYKISCLLEKDIPTLFSEDQIISELKGVDVIVAKPVSYNTTVYEQYAWHEFIHEVSDLELMLDTINSISPQYSDSAQEYMRSYKNYFWNMFIMKKEMFNEYAEWLFSILFTIEKKLDISNRTIVKQRIYAYLAERLTGIYITHIKKTNPNLVIKEKYSIFEEYTDIPQEIAPAFSSSKSIPVIFSSNDAYAPYLCVAIRSLVDNSTSERNYDIFIIDEKISDANKKNIINTATGKNNISIRFVDISPFIKGLDRSIFYCHGHFSISTYYRFFIPRIFSCFDKILYLDCDIVILEDVSKLFDHPLNGNIIGAVKDIEVIRSIHPASPNYRYRLDYTTRVLGITNPENYFQAGVLVMNAKKMREIGFEELCIKRLKEIKTPGYVDQDILNSLFLGDISYIDTSWNVEWQLPIYHKNLESVLPQPLHNSYTIAYGCPKIIHYCSIYKPWKSPELPLANHFWEYARKTQCYEDILFKHMRNPYMPVPPIVNKPIISNKIRSFKYFIYSILCNFTLGETKQKFSRKKQKYKKTPKNKIMTYTKAIRHYFTYKINTIFTSKTKKEKYRSKKKEAKHFIIQHHKNHPFMLSYAILRLFQPIFNKKHYILYDNLQDIHSEPLDGYTLFKYMQSSGIPCLYVINKKNIFYEKIKKDKNIIGIKKESSIFSSLFLSLLRCHGILASSYLSQQEDILLRRNKYIKYIYLDHGVVYLKDSAVNRYSPKYFNKIVVSNSYEAHIYATQVGWKTSDMIRGGLPRWDLLKRDSKTKRIFCFFTWRGSLNPDFISFANKQREKPLSIEDYEYIQKIRSLLKNKRLLKILNTNKITLTFAMHHALMDICKMESSFFRNASIELVENKNISQYIGKSSLLITDYSSIAFDFMYLNIPCIFYKMDINDSLLCNEDSSDLRKAKEKDGMLYNCLYKEDDVVSRVEHYIKNNFANEEENLRKNQSFFYYRHDFCKRILENAGIYKLPTLSLSDKIKYWRYKLLSQITFGTKRKKYKQKKKELKTKLKYVRNFLKQK